MADDDKLTGKEVAGAIAMLGIIGTIVYRVVDLSPPWDKLVPVASVAAFAAAVITWIVAASMESAAKKQVAAQAAAQEQWERHQAWQAQQRAEAFDRAVQEEKERLRREGY
ncbi:MAG: hypothetical protein WAV90_19350 [Gordonia amarae]